MAKSTYVKEIEILEPKWSTREIYIATYKVDEHNVIFFTKDNAIKSFPDRYYLSGKTIRKYPVYGMPTKLGGIQRVYRVPVDELVIYEGRS